MNFIDKRRINRALRSVGNYDLDDVLERVGLERRHNVGAGIAADVGFFFIGALCGALAGVFYAPWRGKELRRNFKRAIDEKGFLGGLSDVARQQPLDA